MLIKLKIYFLIFFSLSASSMVIKSLDNSLVGIAVKVFFQSIIFFPLCKDFNGLNVFKFNTSQYSMLYFLELCMIEKI